MSFDELRRGLLKAPDRGTHLPFWIINATATKYRNGFSWLRDSLPVPVDDVFEMTAISHGSGRYGFVATSPVLHDMNVLDAVGAAAAFFDSNQQLVQPPARFWVGLGLHVLNMNWGIDIRNYNVADGRASLHMALIIPFYGLDGLLYPHSLKREDHLTERQKNAYDDRERSPFIRLADGGNGENLGLLSLVKRGVRNIVVVDAGGDSAGKMSDLCLAVKHFAEHTVGDGHKYIYLPGLDNLHEYCNGKQDAGYPIRRWTLDFPVLLGCIRSEARTQKENPCDDLSGRDSRLFFIKPAFDFQYFLKEQMEKSGGRYVLTHCWLPDAAQKGTGATRQLPCESALFVMRTLDPRSTKKISCPKFPQHSTATATANSSASIYGAYRELGRQRALQAASMLGRLMKDDLDGAANREFVELMQQQESQRLKASPTSGLIFQELGEDGCGT